MLVKLTGHMSKNKSCNVRVVNELINQSNTCIVNDHNGVAALVCDLNKC